MGVLHMSSPRGFMKFASGAHPGVIVERPGGTAPSAEGPLLLPSLVNYLLGQRSPTFLAPGAGVPMRI